MTRFSVACTTSGAVDAAEVGANLWNPHGSLPLRVVWVSVDMAGQVTGGVTMRLIRTSTQGSGGATYTPDADNHYSRRAAPQSAAVLRRGDFSTSPTAVGSGLVVAHLGVPSGSAFHRWLQQPIIVPGGSGLGVAFSGAANGIAYAFRWDE